MHRRVEQGVARHFQGVGRVAPGRADITHTGTSTEALEVAIVEGVVRPGRRRVARHRVGGGAFGGDGRAYTDVADGRITHGTVGLADAVVQVSVSRRDIQVVVEAGLAFQFKPTGLHFAVLIYPKRPDKEREYRELAVRTFYLSHGDAKVVAAEIKQVLKPKEVLVDERLNAVIVRDGLDTLSAVEKMVEALDIAQAEVTIGIQVLERAVSGEQNLGIDYPDAIGLSVGNLANVPAGLAGIPLSALRGLNSDNVLLDAGSTSARINMLQRSGNTVTLANPRVRVRNREEAQVNIGDKIPVVTTTTANQITTSSVSYQDVGLQITVKPTISLSDEVNLELNVEMSHITKRIPGSENVPATFELGSRSTKTLLTARNNETQIVSGLIRTAEVEEGSGLPWLSQIPWIGKKLFGTNQSTQQKTEIILLLTPRIKRHIINSS